MEFKIKNNQLCLYNHNQCIIENIHCSLIHQEKEILNNDTHWMIEKQKDLSIAVSSNCKIVLKKENHGVKFQVSLTNTKQNFQNVSYFCAFKGLYHHSIKKCLINHFVYANDNMVNEMQSTLEVFTLLFGKQVMSADNVAFIDEKERNVLFGLVTFNEYFNTVYCSHDGTLQVHHHLEHHPVSLNETICSDWIYIGFYPDIPYHGLPQYAKIIAKNMNVNLTHKVPPVGYCTWYYYYSSISENTLNQNIDFIQNHVPFPIQYIQIDDGWQICWGQWEPNSKFTHFKQLVQEIKSKGYKPGLWFAPFGVDKNSYLFQHHQDWFVKQWESDEIYGIPSLDFSHPEVKKYIYDLFYTYAHEYGFCYFKLDIITSRLAPGRYYDPSFNTLKNLQEGFRIIKEAIGKDGEILACTCPLAPVAGLCDYMRISGDVFGTWESLVYIFNSTLKRYYLHQNLYITDADCLVIRKKENEDEECRLACVRNDDEIITYLTLLASNGGSIMLADKLQNLSTKQLQLIDKIFPNVSFSAIPMDLMESHLISKLDFKNINDIQVYILVNWEEKDKKFDLPMNNHHVYSFWDDQYEGIYQSTYSCVLQPHCCKVLQVSPVKPLSIIGSNATIRPIIKQKRNYQILKGSFIKNQERQYIYSIYPLKPQKHLIKIRPHLYQIENKENQKYHQVEMSLPTSKLQK